MNVRLVFIAAQVLNHVDSGDDLRELGNLLPLLLASLFFARLKRTFLTLNHVILNVQLRDLVVQLHDLLDHCALIVVDLSLLLLKLIGYLVFLLLKLFLCFIELFMAVQNLLNLRIGIVVLHFDFLQELVVLFNGILLLLDALFLRDQNLQLCAFSFDLNVPLLIFLSQSGNILIASAHLLGVLV